MLVAIAVVIAAAFMITRTAQAIVSSTSCNDSPVLVNVAVTADLAPSVEQVARVFDGQHHVVAGGHCAEVEVTQGESATEAAQIDGQQSSGGLPRADAWIPDSSLWVEVARSFPVGARAIQPTGVQVARSPLMIVMPAAAAARTPAFGASVGWNFLLPQSVGGPSSALGLRVDLPDPAQSAAGLATLLQIGRLLGTGPAARADFTKFVFNAEVTPEFNGPTSLASFVRLAAPPLNGHPVTITSEQAVVQYDQDNPRQPLAARYPSGDSAQLGSPELDYPYVLTTSNPQELQAAKDFEAALRQPYAGAVFRYNGFRSANGVPDALPASFGLGGQILQLAAPPAASEAESTLQVWNKLGLGSMDLALIDVSSAMDQPSGIDGQTLEQELTQTAGLGLSLFPDSTHMGLWEMVNNPSTGKAYQQLVPVGPLPAELGLISRREQVQQVIETLHPQPDSTLALHSAILAAYKTMVAGYQPKYANAVLVLTSGVDSDHGDLPLSKLLSELHALYNPARRVEIVVIMFGNAGDFPALQQVAAATGGGAYEITNPAQVGTVFFEAVARRICDPSCAAP